MLCSQWAEYQFQVNYPFKLLPSYVCLKSSVSCFESLKGDVHRILPNSQHIRKLHLVVKRPLIILFWGCSLFCGCFSNVQVRVSVRSSVRRSTVWTWTPTGWVPPLFGFRSIQASLPRTNASSSAVPMGPDTFMSSLQRYVANLLGSFVYRKRKHNWPVSVFISCSLGFTSASSQITFRQQPHGPRLNTLTPLSS